MNHRRQKHHRKETKRGYYSAPKTDFIGHRQYLITLRGHTHWIRIFPEVAFKISLSTCDFSGFIFEKTF